ncbi:TetR family transcriptional regulator [Gemmatimonadetes bacterium T265]|nr:TetR family transcriptional regulator [Gemmatimonadetes bacterium T265]
MATEPVDLPTPAPPAGVLRRVPQQDRGQRRIERILDAAAAVIGEVGVEAASTNAIAARAETSVGSLYQFFPNKDAIVQALAMRYTAMFGRLKETILAADVADQPLDAMMRGIVEPIAAFCDEHPAYRHVFAAGTTPGSEAAAADAALHATVVNRVEALVARRMPWVAPAQRRATAVVQVETVHAVLFHVQGLPAAERPPLRRELVRQLVAALEPFDRERPAVA